MGGDDFGGGLWILVAVNSAIFIAFAATFFHPHGRRDWRVMGAYSAFTDRGETAEAEKILSLLTDDWGYPVNPADLDPNDTLVDTATEYMYQMATISHHVLNSEQKAALVDHADYKDQHFMPGDYEFAIAGRYWSQFDGANPVEARAREQAWTGTAQALVAELGVGSVTATAIQMGFGIAAIAAALGATFVLLGGGLFWAARRPS